MIHKTEEWRPVVGAKNEYEVSNLGRIRSLVKPWAHGTIKRARPHLLTTQNGGCGYRKVWIRGRQRLVHSLVLSAFCGPRPRGYVCAHLNGNPSDNRIDNLCWATPSQNNAHQRIHGTMPCGSRNYNAKLTEQYVREIRMAIENGARQQELADKYGVIHSTIWKISKRLSWRHVI